MSICAKVYNKLLLNRIHAFVDHKLRHNQAGFRPGRSCTQQIYILRQIIEGVSIKQLPLVVATFIDFRKASGNIQRAQSQLSSTINLAASVRLMINTDKTEYITSNYPVNQNLMVGKKALK